MKYEFFLSGVCMATFAASGLFFFKSWLASRDFFYFYFAIACGLFSFERIVLMVVHDHDHLSGVHAESDQASWIYLIRLIGFLIILFAIIGKNRRAKIS